MIPDSLFSNKNCWLGSFGGSLHFGSDREDGAAAVFAAGAAGAMRSHWGAALGAGHQSDWLERMEFAGAITALARMSLFGECHR